MNNIIGTFIKDKETLTYWEINCIQYAAAITLIEQNATLKNILKTTINNKKRKWISEAENQINVIRRKISYITLILQLPDNNNITNKQKNISNIVRKICGNLKKTSLQSKLSLLKHDLRICNTKLTDDLKKAERSRINYQFSTNQKQVFRNWRNKGTEIKDPPTIDNIKMFWADIWEKETPINLDSEWYDILKHSYATDVTNKNYEITNDIFNTIMLKMANNKAPGTDRITSFWIKRLTSVHPRLLSLLQKTGRGEIDIPDWLAISMTNILPKNADTHLAKNYRPIACQNITYKLYTGILNEFLYDHCATNNIITLEQAGGKKGLWGCTDQLLINKMILDEVRSNRRNLFMMWFDYKKAFDSIPHRYLFEALKLAKVPIMLQNAIFSLTEKWATNIYLRTNEKVSVTDTIRYLTGVLQGDCLSLLLFILCLNPLSFLLDKTCNGYLAGTTGNRTTKINHLLFVDDLKTYAPNKETALKQLQLITTFTNDIGMTFGTDKCAYLYIERGQRKTLGETITLNGLQLNELVDNDSYKYLGCDEDIAYRGNLNKERVTKEYFNRVRKIWKSELYSKNKIIAHNIFAIPIFTLTFGVLNWTKDEIQQIDVKTRKILTYTGNYHKNSSVDRLYTKREDGGRGLISIFDVFVTRIIATAEHLKAMSASHKYLKLVTVHEKDRLLRTSTALCNSLGITDHINETTANIPILVKDTIKKNHKKTWNNKNQHGFITTHQQNTHDYNKQLSHSWLKRQGTISHTEGFICAIQEQEIRTRSLISKREQPDNPSYDKKCRYCHNHTEDIFHLLCSCSHLSASLYLPVRHDEVAKTVYNAVISKHQKDHRYTLPYPVWSNEYIEIWWDTIIKTVPIVHHNKPDIVVWLKKENKCFIIDICVPLDENVHKQEKIKIDNYTLLKIGLSRLYPNYTYEVVPIVLGATGLVTNSLVNYMSNIFTKNETLELIQKLQQKALIGSMRIIKSALSMKS